MGSADPKYRLRKVSSVKVIWTVEQQDFGTQEPSCSSVPQAAMANLFIVMTLALSALPATPVAVFVVGKMIEGLL